MAPLPAALAAVLAAAAGLLGGAAAGYAARRARLCSFAAAEALWLAGDALRLRAFAAALAVAVAGTQALAAAGLLDLDGVRMLPAALPLGGALLGGMLFGTGMALVGTCAFGSLVRLGGGDMRALVTLLVFGAAAWATLAGVLAWAGPTLLAPLGLPMSAPDLPRLLGAASPLGRAAVALAAALGLLLWALADPRLRRAPRLLWAGCVLGGAVVLGWVATGLAADPFEGHGQPPYSLSFVAPVARVLYAALLAPDALAGLGPASVLGVAAGAALAARAAGELRWEAFDDHREMGRHLAGACLMGVGGVWAGGCTIGQGLTAGSVLAPSWPFAVGGILVGARLGIAVLLSGGVREAVREVIRRARPRPAAGAALRPARASPVLVGPAGPQAARMPPRND